MSGKKTVRWHNWSSSVKSMPREILRPDNLEDLARLVKNCARAGRHIRVVGAGHSFTPLVQTSDTLISLDHMQGIESIDATSSQVTIRGGSRLYTLGNDLLARGLAQENLGDIDTQSIAGAISTGTHGTGITLGTIATQVTGLTLVTADGEILECSEEQHPEIFKAAQTSFGTLGIIARVVLRVVPARRLRYQVRREPLSQVFANLERYRQENTHFEFYWFPHTEWAQTKCMNQTDDAATPGNLLSTLNKLVLENWVYWLLSEACRLVPPLCQTVSHISVAALATVSETNYSHRLFATPRMVKFQEMEYNLPIEHFQTVLEQVKETIHKHQTHVHFPIECRFVKGDDIWLSPAFQRDSAYIAVHMYKGMPYTAYFRSCEAIYQNYQGRPHWGKMHTLDYHTLARLYPRWQDFLRIREQLDPHGLFLNDYLQSLLGIGEAQSIGEQQG